MAAHRIFNYFGRVLAAWLAVTGLLASEQHGFVKANGMPIPGATVTASQAGQKSVVTTTDDNGAYSFADLPDGLWTITVEFLGFAKISREVGVMADSPSPTWELKVQSLSDLNKDVAEIKKAAPATATAAAPTAPPAAGAAAATPAATANNKPAAAPATTPAPAGSTASNGRGGRANNGRPSLTQALNQQRNGSTGNTGFQRVDVNASGQQGQDNSFGNDNAVNGDLAQSSSDALVVGGSVSDALGMPQQNDWGFGGRAAIWADLSALALADRVDLATTTEFPAKADRRRTRRRRRAWRRTRGGGAPVGAMMGGGPGGFGGGGGRGGGGRGGGGAPGGRGGRAGRGGPNANSFGNGRRNPRSQYNGNVVFTLDNSAWDATPNTVTGINAGKLAYAKFRAGFTFGGPLKIPHLFDDSAHSGTFTLTYNLNRSRNANTVFGEVPTADERTGDLSRRSDCGWSTRDHLLSNQRDAVCRKHHSHDAAELSGTGAVGVLSTAEYRGQCPIQLSDGIAQHDQYG